MEKTIVLTEQQADVLKQILLVEEKDESYDRTTKVIIMHLVDKLSE